MIPRETSLVIRCLRLEQRAWKLDQVLAAAIEDKRIVTKLYAEEKKKRWPLSKRGK